MSEQNEFKSQLENCLKSLDDNGLLIAIDEFEKIDAFYREKWGLASFCANLCSGGMILEPSLLAIIVSGAYAEGSATMDQVISAFEKAHRAWDNLYWRNAEVHIVKAAATVGQFGWHSRSDNGGVAAVNAVQNSVSYFQLIGKSAEDAEKFQTKELRRILTKLINEG